MEFDATPGVVSEIAAEPGVPVPANKTVYALASMRGRTPTHGQTCA